MTLRSLPVVLCFHLKRFKQSMVDGNVHKIDTYVRCGRRPLPQSGPLAPRVRVAADAHAPSALGPTPFASFPEEVNLHPFLAHTAGRDAPGHSNGHDFDGPVDESDNYKYTLFAVINHIGTLEQGHYTNYVRLASQEGQWFRCDDHVITLADRRTVLASQAYMLYYIKTRLEYRR